MKLGLLTLILSCCGYAAVAQNPYIALEGATEQAGGVVVSQPATVLAVDVTAERDVTLVGPYARYAQKFLGIRAPLNDKTVYAFRDASVGLLNGDEYLQAATPGADAQRVLSHTVATDEFARIQPDKTDMLIPSLEDAAREAANTIYSLRKHRQELITGEAGENVFGEGLESALAEIARLEQEYLELFLGKRIVTTQTRRYVVYPKSDKKQHIVCRFSSADGLLPEHDLLGEMVLLQIEPSGFAPAPAAASVKDRNVVRCRVAAMATCTVTCGTSEYARTVLPIFEFGRTVNVAVPSLK